MTPVRPAGFTLIEMLVVIVLLGVTSLLAVVNYSRSDRDLLGEEAERVALDLEMAFDLGRLSGLPVALLVNGPGEYRFLHRDHENRWRMPENALAHPRYLRFSSLQATTGEGALRFGVPYPIHAEQGLSIDMSYQEQRARLLFSPVGSVQVVWVTP